MRLKSVAAHAVYAACMGSFGAVLSNYFDNFVFQWQMCCHKTWHHLFMADCSEHLVHVYSHLENFVTFAEPCYLVIVMTAVNSATWEIYVALRFWLHIDPLPFPGQGNYTVFCSMLKVLSVV